jgi:uncharacterized damage-inducible protein DinB
MKTLLVSMVLLCTVAPASAQLTPEERERCANELRSTRKLFLDSVAGLSEAQWNFKPAPDVWSVAEAAEHIAVAEETILGLVTEKVMKSPAEPDKRAEVKGKDEIILEKTLDRSKKFQAPEMLRPTRRWPTEQEVVDHFKESRDRTLAYVEHTPDDLRDHFLMHPAFGQMDGYQWLLLIAAHSHRHALQIEEVKANPNFPKQ